jgi:hypothetical protein
VIDPLQLASVRAAGMSADAAGYAGKSGSTRTLTLPPRVAADSDDSRRGMHHQPDSSDLDRAERTRGDPRGCWHQGMGGKWSTRSRPSVVDSKAVR